MIPDCLETHRPARTHTGGRLARLAGHTVALVCAGWLGSCATVQEERRQRPTEARKTIYRLALSPELNTASVRVCFTGRPPSRLLPGSSSRASTLSRVEHLTAAGTTVPLDPRDKQIDLHTLQTADCIRYRIDLGEFSDLPWPGGRIVKTIDWLLRAPAKERIGTTAELTVDLPPGIAADLPFPELGPNRYRLEEAAFLYLSHGVFGRFERKTTEYQGSQVTLISPTALMRSTQSALDAQIRRAMDAVATVRGRFPQPQLRILVVPIRSNGPAVLFGQLTRGGKASVLLLVRSDANRNLLADDWTCVHEFAHLLLPFVHRDDAWLSEGLSTYYQEVLRARVGLRTPTEVFERLLLGAQRVLRTDEPLVEQSREMKRRHNYPDVYWGGAVYALAVDVALRERSQGTLSLDGVLQRLPRTTPRIGAITAAELLERLNRAAQSDVFTAIAEAQVYAPAAQAHLRTTTLLRRLGLIDCGESTLGGGEFSPVQCQRGDDDLTACRRHPPPACEPTTAALSLHPAAASAIRDAIVAPVGGPDRPAHSE